MNQLQMSVSDVAMGPVPDVDRGERFSWVRAWCFACDRDLYEAIRTSSGSEVLIVRSVIAQKCEVIERIKTSIPDPHAVALNRAMAFLEGRNSEEWGKNEALMFLHRSVDRDRELLDAMLLRGCGVRGASKRSWRRHLVGGAHAV